MAATTNTQMNSMTSLVRPAVLLEVADLAEALAAERPDLDLALGDLVVEVEEEQAHAFAERERGDHQHQALHAQRREAHRAGGGGAEHARPRRSAGTIVPAAEHRQHAGGVGADGEERRLRHRHLAGQQHDVGGEPEQGVDADGLRQAVVEVHLVLAAFGGEEAAGPKNQENEQQQHHVEVALGDAAELLEHVLEGADQQPGDDRARECCPGRRSP